MTSTPFTAGARSARARRVRLIDRRVKGVRVIEIAAAAILAMLVLWVYLAKAGAASERSEITGLESDIASSRQRIRLLQAQAAWLERPERIERLSTTVLGLRPVGVAHDIGVSDVGEVARGPATLPSSPVGRP